MNQTTPLSDDVQLLSSLRKDGLLTFMLSYFRVGKWMETL